VLEISPGPSPAALPTRDAFFAWRRQPAAFSGLLLCAPAYERWVNFSSFLDHLRHLDSPRSSKEQADENVDFLSDREKAVSLAPVQYFFYESQRSMNSSLVRRFFFLLTLISLVIVPNVAAKVQEALAN
jgi:hypothetical protein